MSFPIHLVVIPTPGFRRQAAGEISCDHLLFFCYTAITSLPTREEILENSRMLPERFSPEEAEAEVDRLLAGQEAFYSSLPSCEIEIVHLPDTAPESAAEEIQTEMLGNGASVSEIAESSQPAGLYFMAETFSAIRL